jgi:Domain of unknown function (DUF4340)
MKVSRGLLINGVIVVLGAASLVTVLVTTGSVSTRDSEGREQSLLPAYRREDVTGLELSANGQQIKLERSAAADGGSAAFELTTPVKELADAATVEKFLGGLSSARALRPVADTLSRGELGLDNPSARIVIKTAKPSYEIDLGGPAPAPQGARYVEVKSAGASVKRLVVTKSVAEDLSFELDAFRLRSVVTVSENDVAKLSIKSPSLDLSLVRGVGKTFLIDGERKVRADRDAVSSVFFQISRLSANRFLTAAEGEAALGPNRGHFELETKDSAAPIRFDAGGTCPGDETELVVVRQTPSVQAACVSRELAATLSLQRDAFVDQHAFSLRVDEVEELVIATAQAKQRLVRNGTSFVLHAKTDTDVELEPGNQRIADLLEARGTVVEDAKLGELGLDPGLSKITLRSSAGRESEVVEEVVRVGNKTAAGNLLVYRESDGVTLEIPRDRARAFALDSTLLYAKKLSEFGPSSFISAEIMGAKGRELLTRGANEAFRLESPQGFDPDVGLSAEVAQTLGALTAERFVSDSDDGSFGLSRSTLSVHFTFKTETNPRAEHTLRFGDETELGVYATLDQNGPVFVLQRIVKDTLDTLLIDRSVFTAQPASLNSFTLAARGRSLRFERHGDQLQPAPGVSFPEDRLPGLLEALANLRPEAAIHTGPAEAAEGFSKPILSLQLSPTTGSPQTVTFGAGDSWRDTSVFYLRVAGVNATFVIAQSKVRALLEAFRS